MIAELLDTASAHSGLAMNVTSDICVSLDHGNPQKIFSGYNNKAGRDRNARDRCNDLIDGPEIQRAELSSLNGGRDS